MSSIVLQPMKSDAYGATTRSNFSSAPASTVSTANQLGGSALISARKISAHLRPTDHSCVNLLQLPEAAVLRP